MDPIPLVRASALLPFVSFLSQMGAPIESRLEAVMVPWRALEEPESLIPLNQGLLFLDRAAVAEGLEDLGVLAAKKIHFAQLGAFGRLICQSLTLHDALVKIFRIFSLYNSGQKIWLEPWGKSVCVSHRYAANIGPGREYGEQFTSMLLIDCIRIVAGPRWWPIEIHLESASWEKIGRRPDTFGGTPLILHETSGVVFDPVLLSRPIEAVGSARKDAAERGYEALKATAPAVEFPESVQQLLRLFLTDGRFDIEHVAAMAGMRARTFQRRLAECGLDYRALVDSARFDACISLLDDRKIKLIDVAFELGYSEVASFTRAFRRWTGVAPSAFRRLQSEIA